MKSIQNSNTAAGGSAATKENNSGHIHLKPMFRPELVKLIRGNAEGVLASQEVKETLAILILEASKALKMEIEDLIRFSSTAPGKISMTALGIGMINQLRPSTSQMGFSIVYPAFAKTELVNRNIIA